MYFIYKKKNNQEVLINSLEPNFWRPPTDNDYGAKLPEKLSIWKNVMDTFIIKSIKYEELLIGAFKNKTKGSFKVFVTGTILEGKAILIINYFLSYEAFLKVNYAIEPIDLELPMLPRFGMKMKIPKEFENMEWYGRGPHESYWDRKTSAFIGKYKGKVGNQFHPYVKPQETGNKTDVEWMKLTNDNGNGWYIKGYPPLSISALHYDISDLDGGIKKTQTHAGMLKERDFVNVCIDMQQMGVGGNNSWGATALKKYLLPCQSYEFSFLMKMI